MELERSISRAWIDRGACGSGPNRPGCGNLARMIDMFRALWTFLFTSTVHETRGFTPRFGRSATSDLADQRPMIFGLSPTGDLAYRRLAIWPISDQKFGLLTTSKLAYQRPKAWPIHDLKLGLSSTNAWPIADQKLGLSPTGTLADQRLAIKFFAQYSKVFQRSQVRNRPLL